MPKKFGTNSKAEEARARKQEVKRSDAEKKAKEKEDAKWVETDRKVIQKEEKRKEEEQKRLEQQKRRAELKALEQKEQEELAKYAKKPSMKLTKAQIEEDKERERLKKIELEKKKQKEEEELPPIEENINHILRDEYLKLGDGEFVDARSIEDAISNMAVDGKADRHPEKRLRAAFSAYEKTRMPELRKENPSLKLSQLRDILWKEWQKSPDNPINQRSE